MDEQVVERSRLDIRADDEPLSPPWLREPLHRGASTVTCFGFVPHAEIDVEIDGAVMAGVPGGFPEPVGSMIGVSSPLGDGSTVRVRQRSGSATSDWSPPLTVRAHTVDHPAGPPRPRIAPSGILAGGTRTAVANLLGGGHVRVDADGIEVGRVDRCAADRQGVTVNPFAPGQRVRATAELDGDPGPPSPEYVVPDAPSSLPAPDLGPAYEGGHQLRVAGVLAGALVSLRRNGTPVGTYRCWGGELLVGLDPAFGVGETFHASQQLGEAANPPSGIGTTTVLSAAALPPPTVGPVQDGDTAVVITNSAPGTEIRIHRGFVQVGRGSAPVVRLTEPLAGGDRVHVTQSFPGGDSRLALSLTVAGFDPPVGDDPAALDLFPVGHTRYEDGPARGTVLYPADDDGQDAPFNRRLAGVSRAPIVLLAHGNHDATVPSHLGYEYLQRSLARMGMIAVSVDCTALNGTAGGLGDIEDRAELVIASIRHLQALGADAGSLLGERIDFERVGLMGHSRGAEAMVRIADHAGSVGITVMACLALAPTNNGYWYSAAAKPSGYSFMTILPAADGDVDMNAGAQFYDRALPGPFKSQVYVHNMNHNFFNRQWIDDDADQPVLDRGAHERVLDVYGCAFFRAGLLGHDTHRYLDGTLRPGGAPTAPVDLAYLDIGAEAVDHHDDHNGIGTNLSGRPTSPSGPVLVDEYAFDQAAEAFNSTFFGYTMGMVMEPTVVVGEPETPTFRTEVGSLDLTGSEVWLRVAEVAEKVLPAGATGFSLGLEDAAGSIGWIDSDTVGGVPRPFYRPTDIKTMLSTLRFRPGLARTQNAALDLGTIVAILIRLDRPGPRPIAFDDLYIVTP